MSGFTTGPYNYNRFSEDEQESDSLMDSYRAIYEEKCDDKPSFVGKDKKKSDKEDSENKESKKDDEDEDSDSDDKKKKLPPWLKGKMDESVIDYLMSEGYASNEVSAEVIAQHMSESWLEETTNAIQSVMNANGGSKNFITGKQKPHHPALPVKDGVKPYKEPKPINTNTGR